jgi:hypothetical protein
MPVADLVQFAAGCPVYIASRARALSSHLDLEQRSSEPRGPVYKSPISMRMQLKLWRVENRLCRLIGSPKLQGCHA